MNTLKAILEARPQPQPDYLDALTEALTALALCEQACIICADSCLAEKSPRDLRACIQLNLECAEICGATARLLLRQNESAGGALHDQLHTCSVACQSCADECTLQAGRHRHCALCAEFCRHGQEKCNELIGEFASQGLAIRD